MKLLDSRLNQILIILIAFLSFILISGSIVGLSRKANEPKQKIIIQQDLIQIKALNSIDKNLQNAYFDFGRIRVLTAPDIKHNDNSGTTAVLNPFLTYPESDMAFYEELARKKGVIRGIITTYFAKHSKKELLSITEEELTSELLGEINKNLSLGQCQNLFFTEYIYLD